MAIFGKKKDYVDLSEKMRRNQEKIDSFRGDVSIPTPTTTESTGSSSGGGFFGSFFGGGGSSAPAVTETESPILDNDRKRKLAKRLMEMTSKIEDLENQIYQLKQKVEVLEHKQKIGY